MDPAESLAERLERIRAQLKEGRGENIRAVEEEGRFAEAQAFEQRKEDRNSEHSRKRPRSKVGRTDRQNGDAYSKSMRKRIARMRLQQAERRKSLGHVQSTDAEDSGERCIVYGGEGKLKPGAAERVAQELRLLEEKKVLHRKKDAFDEEKDDIAFINDPNRKFNKAIDKHYEKYDSVREIKESLERGTALP